MICIVAFVLSLYPNVSWLEHVRICIGPYICIYVYTKKLADKALDDKVFG